MLEDYGDYLRQHDLEIWSKDDERTKATRAYCVKNDNAKTFTAKCRERSDETVANIMLTQIRQIDSMLAAVMKRAESEFIRDGGIKEAMSRLRRNARGY